MMMEVSPRDGQCSPSEAECWCTDPPQTCPIEAFKAFLASPGAIEVMLATDENYEDDEDDEDDGDDEEEEKDEEGEEGDEDEEDDEDDGDQVIKVFK